jgi:GTP-binding protein
MAKAAAHRDVELPVVAVVGRPNVGKSSLVNRVIGSREAIVEETPGVTRDRRSFAAEWGGRTFEILDTGGLETGAEGLGARVGEQARFSIEIADLVLLVVDAVVGPQEDDLRVADMLRKAGKPTIVVANKVDSAADESEVAAFYRLGLGEPIGVSALHGRGSGDLLDRVIALLPAPDAAPRPEWASVAIVGKPNVGKSSLLNALLGELRALVDPAPGTTRDPTDSWLRLDETRQIRIVDTAGMRRRTHIQDPIEYFSYLRSRRTLRRVDAAILVIDAAQGVTALDQRLAEQIESEGLACVLVLNKWDLLVDEDERRRTERSVVEGLRFVPWAPVVRTSAVDGRGIAKVLPALERALESHRKRISTARVNSLLRDAQDRRPHARTGGRPIRVLYGAQARVEPPTFVLFTTGQLEASYLRYLENRIRELEPFEGSPIKLQVRRRKRSTSSSS